MALDLLIGWQPFETGFRGEKVTMEIRPFRRKAMMVVVPYITKGTPEIKEHMDEKEIGSLADSAFELQALAADILPEHVRNIQGITLNGQPLSFEDLAEEPTLLPLTLAIITQIASLSALDSGEAKNSGGPSGSTAEQAGTEA